MSATDELLRSQLDLLRDMQMAGMDMETWLSWREKVDEVYHEYELARKIEKDEKASAEDRKRAKDQADSVAKALPAITKSVIGAVNAFNKGDAITGSAELMDICASIAPVISTFLSAAGPEGALIGALFSVVGQILRCFGPKQESDVSKIQKILNELAAQRELEDIKAVHDAVLTYASTLVWQAAALRTLLAKPLQNHEHYKEFYRVLQESTIVLADINPHSSVAMFEQWKVLEYLENKENHNQGLWPTVLGVCCKTYSDMVATTMTITLMTNTDDMLDRLKDVEPATSKLAESDRKTIEKSLLRLQAYANVRKLEYQSCNSRMLRALKGLTEVAQGWGLFTHIGDNYGLYFLTGPKPLKEGAWIPRSDRNFYHRVSIIPDLAAVIKDGQPVSSFEFKPRHHSLILKSSSRAYPGSSHWVDHAWIQQSDTLNLDAARSIQDNFSPAFSDVWAIQSSDKELRIFAGTGEVAGAPGSVTAWTLDAKDQYGTQLERVNWWPQTRAAVESIRAVWSPTAIPGDPDFEAMPPKWQDFMLYASLRGLTEIYLNFGNTDRYVPGPAGWGPASGIATDQDCLWMFQPFGFAFTTHASVMSYVKGKRPAPRWILYDRLPANVLGEGLNRGDGAEHWHLNNMPVPRKPPYRGQIAMSPCEDGTFFIAVVHRTIEANPIPHVRMDWNATDEIKMWTATYDIDMEKGAINVGQWTQVPGKAEHVQKLPMPGWSLFANLRANLSAPLK